MGHFLGHFLSNFKILLNCHPAGTSSGGPSGQSGPVGGGPYCLCVAVKRQVIIYEITRLKSRHKRLREVLLPAQAQCLNVFSEGRLCVGYQSGFTIYSLMGDQHPLCEFERWKPSGGISRWPFSIQMLSHDMTH